MINLENNSKFSRGFSRWIFSSAGFLRKSLKPYGVSAELFFFPEEVSVSWRENTKLPEAPEVVTNDPALPCLPAGTHELGWVAWGDATQCAVCMRAGACGEWGRSLKIDWIWVDLWSVLHTYILLQLPSCFENDNFYS